MNSKNLEKAMRIYHEADSCLTELLQMVGITLINT